MFKFEKLDAWKVSLELYRTIAAAIKQFRRDQRPRSGRCRISLSLSGPPLSLSLSLSVLSS